MEARAAKTTARSAAEEALLDAAERVLVDVGYAGITTRRLAEEAGVNHGLVHYYFGSVENLLVRDARAVHRAADRAAARACTPRDEPFLEKWRTAMRYLVSEDVDLREGLARAPGARLESTPDLRERLARVNAEWRAVLTEAFEEPHRELGIEMPLDALVSLVMTFNIGIIVERLGGIETGHDELLDWIDRMAVELTTPRGGADAGPLPGRVRLRRARRREGLLRGLRLGRADRLAPADVVDHPLAPLEDADPLPGSPLPGAHLRRARQRPLGPAAGAGGLRRARVRRRRARGHGRDRDRTSAVIVGFSLGAQRGAAARGRAPRASRGRRLRLPRRTRAAESLSPSAPASTGRRSSTPTRAGRSTTSTTGCATTTASSSSSCRRCSPSRTRRSRSRTRSAGGSRRRRETLVPTQDGGTSSRRRCATLARARDLPGARHPRRGRRDHSATPRHRARRAHAAVSSCCSRARATRPHVRDPVKVNLLLRDFVAPAPPGRALGPRQVAAQARALHLLADRPRPRPARRGDRRRAAQAPPRPRDRLARAASGHRGAGGARRAHPPGQRAPGERVDAHRERVGRARPALLPGDPPDGRDPARELHGLPRPRARRGLRPLDRRRGVGARLLPAREPGAEARRLRLADRLRRLAADVRRRRARGVPDRRLQRGDDRAHRALPPRARPRGLRRQSGRHRRRTPSAPTCR